MKKHLLFICLANIDRSPAAETLFKDSDKYEAKSCGIDSFATIPVSKEALEWADKIFCMQHEHKQFIIDHFDVDVNKIIVLNVGNEYARGDPGLERVLRGKLKDYLE